VTRTLKNPLRWMFAAGVLSLLLIIATAGSASAATYPKGGNSFTGGAEGWKGEAKCGIEVKILELSKVLLCPSQAGYDSTAGNPAGSLETSGETLVTAIGLFKTEGTLESPNFTVGDGGGGSISLQRAFSPGGLLSLTPQMHYTASLVDKTSGTTQKAIDETVEGESGFVAKSGGVNLVAGHTYAVKIETQFAASIISLLTTVKSSFDNVVVTGPGNNPGECTGPSCNGNNGNDGNNGNNGNDGNGNDGGNGANGLTASQLEKLLAGALSGATLKGNKITVKDACPAAIGAACKTTLQGMAKKGKPATSKNVAKVPMGKAKRVSLRVKPKMKTAVKAKRKLLFKVTVKAGKVQVTVWKNLKLKHA
jgi:hypothetical protein